MAIFQINIRDKAIKDFNEQFGIDIAERSNFNTIDEYKEYKVSLSKGYDFVAVINNMCNNRLNSKIWYKYSRASGWFKIASLSYQQSVQLYMETKPSYISSILANQGDRLTQEQLDGCSLVICDEYLSTYMTNYYFGISINVNEYKWESGLYRTEAIYMPIGDL